MRDETKKKAREAHYPAPFRLIDLFETARRRSRSPEGGRDPLLRAAADLGSVAQPAPRLQALRAAQRPGAEGPDLEAAARARHRRGHHGRRYRRLVRRLRHGGDAAGSLGRADRAGHQGSGQAVLAQVQDQGAAKAPPRARLIADPDRASASARADVIIEAIVERLDIKQNLFEELEGKIKPGAVLATNTSSLEVEAIAAPLQRSGPPDRHPLLQSGRADAARRGRARCVRAARRT